jgi:hypothetical protein
MSDGGLNGYMPLEYQTAKRFTPPVTQSFNTVNFDSAEKVRSEPAEKETISVERSSGNSHPSYDVSIKI